MATIVIHPAYAKRETVYNLIIKARSLDCEMFEWKSKYLILKPVPIYRLRAFREAVATLKKPKDWWNYT